MTEQTGILDNAGAEDGRQLPLADAEFEPAELCALVEAMLLVAPEPVSPSDLATAAGVSVERISDAVEALEARTSRGWVILRHGGTLQLATAPRFAAHIRAFLGLERETRLSGAALETLAIVAYRQPVTRAEVEAVRGVDCSGVLATLHARGLVDAVSRLPVVGNPIQYGTTPDFLRHFGLRSLEELPPIGEVGGRDGAALLEAAAAVALGDPDPRPSDAGEEPSADA